MRPIIAAASCAVLAAATVSAQTPISTCADLQAMQSNLSGDYVLTGDIDCAGFDAGFGTGFEPVGTDAAPFTGSLDGQGFAIRNLSAQKPTADRVGLFGSVDGAVIQRLSLEGVDIAGRGGVGALAGLSRNSTVTDVDADGTVSALRAVGFLIGVAFGSDISYVHTSGTLVGYNGGSISHIRYGGLLGALVGGSSLRCAATSVDVQGNYKAGGAVGEVHQSTISQVSATGDVQARYRVGGFVGNNLSGGKIRDSYAMGAVSGSHEVAGFAGLQEGSGALIEDSYSTGTASGGANTRGFIGLFRGGSVVTSFWDTQTSGHTNGGAGGATGLPTADMQTESTFTGAGWDFTSVWVMVDYPRLQWQQPSPEELVGSIIDDVEDLIDAGILGNCPPYSKITVGQNCQGTSLITKLEGALDKIEKGQTKTAVNKLDAFINQVSALRKAGTLTAAQAQALIDAAQAVIDLLLGSPKPAAALQSPQASQLTSYPNPANPSTTIRYVVAQDAPVSLVIYDALGQRVRELVDAHRAAGVHHVSWNGLDARGIPVSSGVYFYRLDVGQRTFSSKMLLLR